MPSIFGQISWKKAAAGKWIKEQSDLAHKEGKEGREIKNQMRISLQSIKN